MLRDMNWVMEQLLEAEEDRLDIWEVHVVTQSLSGKIYVPEGGDLKTLPDQTMT